MMDSEKWMQRAIELAKLGVNFVNPNPRVGAVIIKNGQIVAEGYHQYFGGPHAEINAIENAKGIELEGATLVVNLEPCSHFGKTPPCTSAIIEKRFAKVIIGMVDPNPLVSGKGIQILRNSGIEVETGILGKECRWLNRFFIKNMLENKPYVILKVAQSLDGSIATSNYQSKWITSEKSRELAWKLRREVDAILIGKTTALKDNPTLTLHNLVGKTPLRVLLDTNFSLPLELQVFTDDSREKTILVVSDSLNLSEKADVLTSAGVKILQSPTKDGFIDIEALLQILYEHHNVASVIVEGGSQIYSSFIREDLWDEVNFFVAPKIVPGGISSFGGYSVQSLDEAISIALKSVMPVDSDIHLIGLNPRTDELLFST
jgi:diaminohydroxyphosphoribosylaminopyrimidine deaminase/5-amino-6-(5-phosphoribosylamino)uracil reductase